MDDNTENKEELSEFVSLPLLEVGEAARYLGVGRKVVYDLIERGEIQAVKAKGGKTLLEKASLDAFRDSGRLT